MNAIEHTPEQWRIDDYDGTRGVAIIIDAQDVPIATVWQNNLDPESWARGNAKLILHAAEMYHALRQISRSTLNGEQTLAASCAKGILEKIEG